MSDLTPRQRQILDFIRDQLEDAGLPPTRAEIATALGFKSANAAEEHLQALARKGVIELVGGTSRGIRLRSETLRQLNLQRGKQFSLPLPSLGAAQVIAGPSGLQKASRGVRSGRQGQPCHPESEGPTCRQ